MFKRMLCKLKKKKKTLVTSLVTELSLKTLGGKNIVILSVLLSRVL